MGPAWACALCLTSPQPWRKRLQCHSTTNHHNTPSPCVSRSVSVGRTREQLREPTNQRTINQPTNQPTNANEGNTATTNPSTNPTPRHAHRNTTQHSGAKHRAAAATHRTRRHSNDERSATTNAERRTTNAERRTTNDSQLHRGRLRVITRCKRVIIHFYTFECVILKYNV